MVDVKARVRFERKDGCYRFSVNFIEYEVILTSESGIDFFEKILEAEQADFDRSLLWVSFLSCLDYKVYECCLDVAWCVVQEVPNVS